MTEFRDQLRARFGDRLSDLRLFGSKVRGDDHDESDIDLLVLLGCDARLGRLGGRGGYAGRSRRSPRPGSCSKPVLGREPAEVRRRS
jgi:hypothetical protein